MGNPSCSQIGNLFFDSDLIDESTQPLDEAAL